MMEFCKSIHSFLQSNPTTKFYFGAFRVFLILLHIFSVNSISFNITCFSERSDILFEGDANARDHVILLTAGSQGDVNFSGRAIYKEPVHLWDNATRKITDFTTNFSFAMDSGDEDLPGGRLSSSLAKNGYIMLPNSSGGFLGMVTGKDDPINSTKNHFIAVEFDNQSVKVHIISTGTEFKRLPSITTAQKRLNLLVEYNSSAKNLCVTLIDQADYTVLSGNLNLCCKLDLMNYLPEWVTIGFSAAAGEFTRTYSIYSWQFSSNVKDNYEVLNGTNCGNQKKKVINLALATVIGAGSTFFFIGVALVLLWLFLHRRKKDGDQRKNNVPTKITTDLKLNEPIS